MKVLVTGCNGFLGSNIVRTLFKKYELIGTSINEGDCDISFKEGDLSDIGFVESLFREINPDVVINTVALADVEACEKNPELAYKLNVSTAENIAKTLDSKTKLIHISSDQLFRGNKTFYSEEDKTEPLNIYGKTKAEAEEACMKNHENTVIVRTNFFGFSPEGHKQTFAEWILSKLKNSEQIKLFEDVFFTPIEISHLINAIEKLFYSKYRGILNIAGNERVSKYEFGIRLAKAFGLDASCISKSKIEESELTAQRQKDMSLSVAKYEELFGYKLPDLNESFENFADNKKFDVVIAGAGLTGLISAYFLEQRGIHNYVILESSSEIGGLCRTIREGGFSFDLAPHTIHVKNPEIMKIIKNILDDDLSLDFPIGGIYFNGKIIPYPFQYNLYHLDKETRKKCLDDAISAGNASGSKNPANFEEWMRINLGEGISEFFMIPYNKKCYCIEPREISLDFLGQHIPRFSVEEIKKGAMNDMANSKAGHYSKFYYPKKGGIDNLIKAISKRVKSVNLNEKVIEVDLTKKKVLTEKGGYSYKNLISTIPIKELAGIIKNAPEEIKEARSKLRCNKISFVLLGVKRKDICRYQWLYLPQKDILPFRISFQMNISKKMAPENTSSICSEYSYLEKREISDEELSERTIEDLIKMGIIKKRGEIIFKKVVDIPHAYVIYDFNRRENLNLIKDYLKKNNVHSIGRFGSWEHYSMENCILDSQKTSEKLR